MASIASAAPQFLVENLNDSLDFYARRFGFTRDFVYDDFYVGVSRDGAVIHLKCAPKLAAERAHRRSGEHLDAYLAVTGIDELHAELVGRGAAIAKPLESIGAAGSTGHRNASHSRDYWTVYWDLTRDVKAALDRAGMAEPAPEPDTPSAPSPGAAAQPA